MPTELLYLFDMYRKGGTPVQQQDLAAKIVQKLLKWITSGNADILKSEAEVLSKMRQPGFSAGQMQQVRTAFASLRNLQSLVQTVANNARVAPATVWQQVMQALRQTLASSAGGVRNIGQWVMNGGARFVAGVGSAGIAIRAGLMPLAEGVAAAVVAVVESELFLAAVAAVVVIALLVALVFAIGAACSWNPGARNVQTDPLIQRYSSQQIQLRLPLGNL